MTEHEFLFAETLTQFRTARDLIAATSPPATFPRVVATRREILVLIEDAISALKTEGREG